MNLYLDKTKIKQKGMNPWKKDLIRQIFTDGKRFFVRDNSFLAIEIDGRRYQEVERVLDTWFLK